MYEYMEDPEEFAQGLTLASRYSLIFIDTYNRVRDFAQQRMALSGMTLPASLELPSPLRE